MKEINHDERILLLNKDRIVDPDIKYFEVDNIQDLFDNYEFLSKPTKQIEITSHTDQFKKRNIVKLTGKKLSEAEYLDALCGLTDSYKNPKRVINSVDLHNVYLENFEFIKTELFELCKFDIKDSWDKTLPGMFVYKNLMNTSQEEKNIEQLEKVLYSDGATSFDIDFWAVPEKYVYYEPSFWEKFKLFGKKMPRKVYFRGKLARVYNINQSKGQNQKDDIPDLGDTLPGSSSISDVAEQYQIRVCNIFRL